jgi:hypothetical protein
MNELQEIERRCIRRIERKADALQAIDPRLDRSIALARAIQSLPRSYAAYRNARLHLAQLGALPLPLR